MASDGGSGWYSIDRRTNMIVMDYVDDADSEAIACAPSVAALVDRLAQLALALTRCVSSTRRIPSLRG
jgi:hypothetical protein